MIIPEEESRDTMLSNDKRNRTQRYVIRKRITSSRYFAFRKLKIGKFATLRHIKFLIIQFFHVRDIYEFDTVLRVRYLISRIFDQK